MGIVRQGMLCVVRDWVKVLNSYKVLCMTVSIAHKPSGSSKCYYCYHKDQNKHKSLAPTKQKSKLPKRLRFESGQEFRDK